MELRRLTKRAASVPRVIDATDRIDALPPFQIEGAGAAGVGWEFTVRLAFANGRKARRPIITCCGGRTRAEAEVNLAKRYGGGYITAIEIYAVRHLGATHESGVNG